MPKYVILMNWTDQGVKSAKETVDRAHKAREFVKSMGGDLGTVYWTVGAYDLVSIVDAPDDESLAATLLTIAGGGNLRTQTMRAFDEAGMQSIIDKMP